MRDTRRSFLKKAAAGSALLALEGGFSGLTAAGYRRTSGANSLIRVAVFGCNSRGASLAGTFARQSGTEVKYICDVEENALKKGVDAVIGAAGKEPRTEKDFRRILNDKDLDALVIAMPDHWHSPATIMGCAAGKHVYVEKPMSHNPYEGELVIRAVEKHKTIVQVGTQRRSWSVLAQGLNELKNGIIGRVYMAKAWYANTRGPIGVGRTVPVPAGLDYELWQGPAPRKPFRDNLIHYNWHWFWNWGTGEALNNGTHHLDIIRWGLDLDYPSKVSSAGGRYHYHDDWEVPDTQIITWEVPGITITWEGRSCNGGLVDNRSHGVIFYGEQGTLHTGDNSYTVFDNTNKLVKEVKSDVIISESLNTTSPGEALDAVHVKDFLDNIRNGRTPSADAQNGHKSALWLHLGNISQRVGRSLALDPSNGHITGDSEAEALWRREYENGWQPLV
ncbi:MAG: Gfo/Idh/MocA family oxidoreductase [Bacteroidales bacterium]|jgi:predicted dehydrogenase|nr:Gfo/Idh/MocA family oxidoreductase [Bacteroidales bacterium]HPM18840.1 Gfo/Idh/MocA family oxidoreductase [Bacteroidales bacterium]HQG76774.1 Gfo/Idh/MocA family oxidoreductase [Bacteroidales bacterium]